MKNSSTIIQIEDKIFLSPPLEVKEPTSCQEATNSQNHKEWIDVMRDEMDSVIRNKV